MFWLRNKKNNFQYTFWCILKLLDGIQDNYTFAQPGLQTKVNALKELIKRIDCKYIGSDKQKLKRKIVIIFLPIS